MSDLFSVGTLPYPTSVPAGVGEDVEDMVVWEAARGLGEVWELRVGVFSLDIPHRHKALI